jgi:hypothetical protein
VEGDLRSSTQNVEPCPIFEETPSLPPLSLTICLTKANPRPVPLPPCCLPASVWLKASETALINMAALDTTDQSLTEQLRLIHLLLLDSVPGIGDLDPDDDPLQKLGRFRAVVVFAQAVFGQFVGSGRASGSGPFLRYFTSHPSDFCRIGVEQLGRDLDCSAGRGEFTSVSA